MAEWGSKRKRLCYQPSLVPFRQDVVNFGLQLRKFIPFPLVHISHVLENGRNLSVMVIVAFESPRKGHRQTVDEGFGVGGSPGTQLPFFYCFLWKKLLLTDVPISSVCRRNTTLSDNYRYTSMYFFSGQGQYKL